MYEKTKQRGRKSAASLTVISSSDVETLRRPDPPEELTEEQAAEWRAVVNRLPADWFPQETHQLLVQYCRHVVCARRVAQLIEQAEAADELDIVDYARLLRMQEMEGRAMSSLATRMRLTQQATIRAELARKPLVLPKPWEDDA
jgi:hypothetical protein